MLAVVGVERIRYEHLDRACGVAVQTINQYGVKYRGDGTLIRLQHIHALMPSHSLRATLKSRR